MSTDLGFTTKLPENPDEIMRRLRSVLDEPTAVEMLYPLIARNAGHELAPQGIVLMLTMACVDYGKNYPPLVGETTRRFIPMWIDALIDDKEVAEAAKQSMARIEARVEANLIAKIPPRIEPADPVENYDLYVAMRKVADILFEEISRAQNEGADLHVDFRPHAYGINSVYSQTHSGLFVEYYYGSPSKIWTPWGYWQFVSGVGYSGDPWPAILERFLERTGATEHMPVRHTSYGTVGPVYALHQVDDLELPEPVVRERQNFLDYEVVKHAWEAMTDRYEREHN